jgi:hypothetical protein
MDARVRLSGSALARGPWSDGTCGTGSRRTLAGSSRARGDVGLEANADGPRGARWRAADGWVARAGEPSGARRSDGVAGADGSAGRAMRHRVGAAQPRRAAPELSRP